MGQQKRVLILTSDAGLGHRRASEAIAEALRQAQGEACDVRIVNIMDDERVPEVFRKGRFYDSLLDQDSDLYQWGFKLSDMALPAALADTAVGMLMLQVMRDLIDAHAPHAMVATHPVCQIALNSVANADDIPPFVTVVTDLVTIHRLWFDPAAALCVVPTEAARGQALEQGLTEERVAVIGIPVDPAIAAERRDPATLRAALGWQPDQPALLVVGGKRVSHLRPLLRALNHANLPLQVVAVAGGDDALYRHFQESQWHVETHVYNFVENLPTMMLASDAIVCKAGGLIVTEALACGRPMLLVDVLPGQEQGNADYVIEGGAAVLAKTPVSALETLHHWFVLEDGARRAEKARCAQRLGHPRAAHKIAERLWALASAET